MNDLEIWTKVVTDYRNQTPHATGIFDKMLIELKKRDVELVRTPSYISILEFGRNIFKPIKDYREYYDLLELTK